MIDVLCLFLLAANPVMRIVQPARPATNLLRNSGFEATRGGDQVAWQAWHNGFRLATGEGRSSSRAIVCENRTGEGEFGAGQAVTFDPPSGRITSGSRRSREPVPIVVR